MLGWIGIDFGQYVLIDFVRCVEMNVIVLVVEYLLGGDIVWMIEVLVVWGGIGGMGLVFVGLVLIVVDILQEWVVVIDVDGFNFVYVVVYEIFEDVVCYFVFELQWCGVYLIVYVLGMLCEKFFGGLVWLLGEYLVVQFCDIEQVKCVVEWEVVSV